LFGRVRSRYISDLEPGAGHSLGWRVLTGDATYSFDSAGRLFRAFNPLFAGDTVYTEYGYL
jgi:hypothetical protein